MLKRKLGQYADGNDSQESRRQNNGYPNKSSKIESHAQNSSCRKESASYNESTDLNTDNPTASSDHWSNLLGVLSDILGNNSKTHLIAQLGEGGYTQCTELQSTLAQISYVEQSRIADSCTQKQAEIPTPTSLTPWTVYSIPQNIPLLPQILDPIYEKQAFTHSAVNSTCSYESLEWLGDAYLELIATLLISSTFPDLSPGRSSQLRERLVKNETLAKFSREYGFERRAFLPPEFREGNHRGGSKATIKEREKVMGDIFEAYCAAIIVSDPEHGVNRLTEWLKALWAGTLSSEIRALRPSRTQDEPQHHKNLKPKEILATKIASKGVKINYKDAAPETVSDMIAGHPVFTVGVYLDGWGVVGKLLGIGTGLSKKDAGAKAAEAALANREVLQVYEDMKKEMDAKRREEQATASSTDPATRANH